MTFLTKNPNLKKNVGAAWGGGGGEKGRQQQAEGGPPENQISRYSLYIIIYEISSS